MKRNLLKLAALTATGVLTMWAMTGCWLFDDWEEEPTATTESTTEATTVPTTPESAAVKIGLICLHDETSSYDRNFMDSLEAAKQELGLADEQIVIKTNIPEDEECTAAAKELAESGCNLIFADSFGHESYLLEAAKAYPNVQFCHATGTQAHTAEQANFHDAFASIYEGRYLSGIAAGMKLNEMIDAGKIKPEEAVLGYVGAFPYAEVISGYTAFYLGAKSVCQSATMQVQFTDSWYDEAAEKAAAENLISKGCVVISQHADSMGAPSACEAAGVPNVSYNGSMLEACPNTFVVSSRIDWAPYYVYAANAVKDGTAIDYDWTGTLSTGSVVLTSVNEKAAAAGTQEAIDKAAADLKSGAVHVFDTSTFTVDGKTLDSYLADVDSDPDFTPDTEVIKDGYFHESEYRSAPYFDIKIDGIKILEDNPTVETPAIKLGLICLHDETSSYDRNFMDSLNVVKQELGLTDDQIVIKTKVPEGEECTAVAKELAEDGCNIIFADSFGHESYLLEAAKAYPNVQFCHATGTQAHTAEQANFHDAFASIYEGRYLSGIAAGMKLNEMISLGKIEPEEAVLGYVGAFTYAEVISGYTAFYLGAKSVCPTATMQVQFTGSWYDEAAEKEAAENLISKGCVLISQHADSMGAPSACEAAGVPNISYNVSMQDTCPNTFIVSSRIDWTPYYLYVVKSVQDGTAVGYDWTGTLSTDSVKITSVNDTVAAAGTQDALDKAAAELKAGTLHVFDTSAFTVDGKTLDSYLADVDTDPDFTPDTEVINDGYFYESEFRSAPYFDLRIDGITLLNEKF